MENKVLDATEIAYKTTDAGTTLENLENKFIVTDSVTSVIYNISFAIADEVITIKKPQFKGGR